MHPVSWPTAGSSGVELDCRTQVVAVRLVLASRVVSRDGHLGVSTVDAASCTADRRLPPFDYQI